MDFVIDYLKKVASFAVSVKTLLQLASSCQLGFRFLLDKSFEVFYVSANARK